MKIAAVCFVNVVLVLLAKVSFGQTMKVASSKFSEPIEFQYVLHHKYLNGRRLKDTNLTELEVRYRCVTDGRRVLTETFNVPYNYREVHLFNGKSLLRTSGTASSLTKPSRFVLVEDKRWPSTPLNSFMFFGGEHVNDFIRTNNLKNIRSYVQGDDTVTVYEGQVGKAKYELHMSGKWGLSRRTIRTGQERDVAEYVLDSAKVLNGQHFPSSFHVYGSKDGTPTTNQEVNVTSMRTLNSPAPLSVAIVPGSYMMNVEKDLYWYVGKNGERIYDDIGSTRKSNLTIGLVFVLSLATLLLTAFGAVVHRIRRKRVAS